MHLSILGIKEHDSEKAYCIDSKFIYNDKGPLFDGVFEMYDDKKH